MASSQSFANVSVMKKKAPPQVRQTLTSKYRMLKANPLLMHELGKKLNSTSDDKDMVVIAPLKDLASVLDQSEGPKSSAHSFLKPSVTLQRKEERALSRKDTLKYPYSSSMTNVNKEVKKTQLKRSQSVQKLNKTANQQQIKQRPIGMVQSARKVPSANTSSFVSEEKTRTFNAPKKPFSSQPKKNVDIKKSTQPPVQAAKTCATTSTNVVNTPLVTCKKPTTYYTPVAEMTPILSNSFTDNNNDVFEDVKNEELQKEQPQLTDIVPKTPSVAAIKTSVTTTNNTQKLIYIPVPNSKEMAEKLSEWLKHNSKNSTEYQHLKCFGANAENLKKTEYTLDEQKENIDLNKITENEAGLGLSTVAKEALTDLNKLILDGYPSEQCEIWLKLIKDKCSKVKEEPEYWECRAALEQSKGNLNLAVESYQTAIIHGAKVQEVDKCLDQLLQKFNLLNINETTSQVNNPNRGKVVEDARNIFKSSIIQFAVKERTLKKKDQGEIGEKKFLVTPVRRSTRISRSGYTLTPGVNIYSSLREIDTSLRHNYNFQSNSALND